MDTSQPKPTRWVVVAGPVAVFAAIAIGGLIWSAHAQPPPDPAAKSPPAETPPLRGKPL